MQPPQQIHLTLTLDEVNTALEALGQLPFHRVHLLIARIHQQAAAQLQPEAPDPPPAAERKEGEP